MFSNKAMPGLIKIGFTLKDPTSRADELNQTGVPHPFKVEYEVLVHSPQVLEKNVHSLLGDVREAKEFFRCSVNRAVEAIRAVEDKGIIIEQCYYVDEKEVAQPASESPHSQKNNGTSEKIKNDDKKSPNNVSVKENSLIQNVELDSSESNRIAWNAVAKYSGRCGSCVKKLSLIHI